MMRSRKELNYVFGLPYLVFVLFLVVFYLVMLLILNTESSNSLLIFQLGLSLFSSLIIGVGYVRSIADIINDSKSKTVFQTYMITNKVVMIFLSIVIVLGLKEIISNPDLIITNTVMRYETVRSDGSFWKWLLFSFEVLFNNIYSIALLLIVLITLFDKTIYHVELKKKIDDFNYDELAEIKRNLVEITRELEDVKNENIRLNEFKEKVNAKFEYDKQLYKTCDKCCEAMQIYTGIYERRMKRN